ncbi:MAG TPA: DinB family protein [Ktedonobacterales bacterium]|nr:DinB family protein [Ktedonobacterales bacterium]
MTTPPERYTDLADVMEVDDLALARLVGHLDRALRARTAPPQVHTMLERLLQQRIGAQPALVHILPQAPATLSRRDALKAGAASMAFLFTLSHGGPAMAAELGRLVQEGPMTSTRLVGILQAERAKWNALLAQIGPDRMEEPGVEGTWSAKEIVAHLTWYEGRIVEGARQVMGTGTFTRPQGGLTGLGMDERNARIAEESRARSVSDVLAEADQVFGQVVSLVAAVPQDVLNDSHLLGLPNDLVPWMAVANNSYAHYREHEQAIQAWLGRKTT